MLQEPNVLGSIGNSTHKMVTEGLATPDAIGQQQHAEELKMASTDPQDRTHPTPDMEARGSESEDQFKDVKFSISED